MGRTNRNQWGDQHQGRKENSMESQNKASIVFRRRSEGWTRVDAAEHRKKLGMTQDETEKEEVRGQTTQTARIMLKILAFLSRKFVQVIAWLFVCCLKSFLHTKPIWAVLVQVVYSKELYEQ